MKKSSTSGLQQLEQLRPALIKRTESLKLSNERFAAYLGLPDVKIRVRSERVRDYNTPSNEPEHQ